ncbi:GFA family protein [Devosia sp. A16]|uniref:GFA family protein n=1 Tax=Devosia sp. A16 TaxID=1736675 RepID=UPI0006D7A085|nr:GFA family protein [Devosia sp. A16]
MTASDKPQIELSAGCACGAVTLSVKGRVRSMLLCSCEDCQRATGTGHSTVALVRTGNVAVTGPAASFARPAHSGATLTRWFCPTCGTPLYARSSRAPELLMLPVGLFGSNATWFAPSQLIFARSHHAWDSLPEAIAQHATYRNPEST